MASVRLCGLLVLCLLTGLAGFAFPATEPPQQVLQTTAAADSSHALLQYTLPPDKLEKAYALYLLNGTLYFVTTVWGFLVLYLMLRTRFGVRLRNLATSASRFRMVQAAIVMSVFVLVLALAQLPFDSYQHHVSLKYGLSVQHWDSWFWDWGKGLLLGFLIASFVGWGLYAALRRSPRRWWFYFWLGTIPSVILSSSSAPSGSSRYSISSSR
jgi:STE24 endopeptidase